MLRRMLASRQRSMSSAAATYPSTIQDIQRIWYDPDHEFVTLTIAKGGRRQRTEIDDVARVTVHGAKIVDVNCDIGGPSPRGYKFEGIEAEFDRGLAKITQHPGDESKVDVVIAESR